jgi:putative flippase GtrA
MIQKILNRETAAYLICGAFTTVVGLAVFWVCVRLNQHTATANTVSTVSAVLFAYIVNKIFVFQSKLWSILTVGREMASFFAGRVATYIMETGLLLVMIDMMGWPNMLCKGFTMVLVILSNYCISKWFVFKDKSIDNV